MRDRVDEPRAIERARAGAGSAEGADALAAEAAAWIAAIAARADREAFARLFGAYAPKIKGYLLARGAAGNLADELTQEVMLTLWRKAAQFDPARGTVAAWLFTITRNRLVNHARDSRYPQPELEAELREGAPIPERPDDQLASAEARARLVRALDGLPPEQSAVLRGAYWRGQTLQEHADEQQLPLGTVKTRARLALARLRALLAPEGER